MGLVIQRVRRPHASPPLHGHLAIGHTRYSTTGSSTWRTPSPSTATSAPHAFALGHNGNLTNTEELAAEAGHAAGHRHLRHRPARRAARRRAEHRPTSPLDGRDLEGRSRGAARGSKGAFSLVLMDEAHVIGVRDPNGFRPLCSGALDGGWVLASRDRRRSTSPARTSCASSSRARWSSSTRAACRSERRFAEDRVDPKLCLFEFVYFARPDSQLYGHNVHAARVRMGEQLAEQAPVEADMVMGVPESGIPAAEGFAARSRASPSATGW